MSWRRALGGATVVLVDIPRACARSRRKPSLAQPDSVRASPGSSPPLPDLIQSNTIPHDSPPNQSLAKVQPYLLLPATMLAYRSATADHFAPQPSSSRASALTASASLQPQPRAVYTSSRPSAYDTQPLALSEYAAAPPLPVRREAAPPAPPAAAATAGAAPAPGATTAGKTDKGKLTEQWGAPPDVVKRDKEYLERGKLLGEVSEGLLGRRGGRASFNTVGGRS